MSFPFRFVLLFGLGVALATPAGAASDWQVIKVGNRDYLSVDNIAKFYGLSLSVVDPVLKKVRLDGRNEVEVRLNSREVMVNGVRNWLSFPVTEKDGTLLVSRVDLAKTLEPQLRPHMIPNLGRVRTVVLDPGHGGHEKGATNRYGKEKDFALDVARQLRLLLQAKGFKVIMTRENDAFVPLQMRARIANAARDCIFVSIHFNAADWNPAATGFEIFSLTPVGSPSTDDDDLKLSFMNRQAGSPVDAPSIGLSTSIYHSMVGHFAEFDRGIKRARFAVLRLTKVPAVLVEGGFLTDRAEARLIANKEWRGKLAQAISVGIENYRDLAEKKKRPMLVADYRREQLGGELVARDVTQPAPGNLFATPAILPASNLAQPPAALRSNDNSAAQHPAGLGETQQGITTPGTDLADQTSHDSIVAVGEPVTVEVIATPEPAPENVILSAPVSAPPAETRSEVSVTKNEAVAPTKSPKAKGYWFLGPFPKFRQ